MRSSSGSVLSLSMFSKSDHSLLKCLPKVPIHTRRRHSVVRKCFILSVNVFRTGSERSCIQQFLFSNLPRKGEKHIRTRAVTSYISPESSRLLFSQGPFMITQQAFELNSMKLSMQLPTDPSLPRGGFGVLLLSGDLHI